MKLLGIALLLAGFFWIGYDTLVGIVDDQHAIWIWQSKDMRPGDTLAMSQASGAMRELSLVLKDRHRVMLLPASMMLAGGLIAAFSKTRQRIGPVA